MRVFSVRSTTRFWHAGLTNAGIVLFPGRLPGRRKGPTAWEQG